LSPGSHQMTFDGAPAVHQPAHQDQGGLLVLSSSSDLSGSPAEALPLKGTCDIPTEPFACVGDTAKLDRQLRLAHLVQAGHGAAEPTSTRLSTDRRRPAISADADQVGPEDQ